MIRSHHPKGPDPGAAWPGFTFFSRRLGKGSRLRRLVHRIHSPGTEKNYNSGSVVAAETGKDARTAHVTLLHDREHPSALEIPIGRP
jgi:predicted acyl esterase